MQVGVVCVCVQGVWRCTTNCPHARRSSLPRPVSPFRAMGPAASAHRVLRSVGPRLFRRLCILSSPVCLHLRTEVLRAGVIISREEVLVASLQLLELGSTAWHLVRVHCQECTLVGRAELRVVRQFRQFTTPAEAQGHQALSDHTNNLQVGPQCCASLRSWSLAVENLVLLLPRAAIVCSLTIFGVWPCEFRGRASGLQLAHRPRDFHRWADRLWLISLRIVLRRRASDPADLSAVNVAQLLQLPAVPRYCKHHLSGCHGLCVFLVESPCPAVLRHQHLILVAVTTPNVGPAQLLLEHLSGLLLLLLLQPSLLLLLAFVEDPEQGHFPRQLPLVLPDEASKAACWVALLFSGSGGAVSHGAAGHGAVRVGQRALQQGGGHLVPAVDGVEITGVQEAIEKVLLLPIAHYTTCKDSRIGIDVIYGAVVDLRHGER
mmetsp:Transcript_87785/g.204306  ORF Transcript_87785/g.204306 Transcript_87785/m.204306 type:complete len:433 (+) Transcript_87785:122-1420(+)